MYSYGCGQFEWLRIHAQVVGAAGVAAALGAVPNPPAAALGAVPNPPAAGGNNVKRASHANRLMVGCMQWLCMRMLCLRVLSMCVGECTCNVRISQRTDSDEIGRAHV